VALIIEISSVILFTSCSTSFLLSFSFSFSFSFFCAALGSYVLNIACLTRVAGPTST